MINFIPADDAIATGAGLRRLHSALYTGAYLVSTYNLRYSFDIIVIDVGDIQKRS